MLTPRENHIRNITFNHPEYIPCDVYVSHASLSECGAELADMMKRYPSVFSDSIPGKNVSKPGESQIDFDNYDFPPEQRIGDLIDPWGCKWQCSVNGLVGAVVEHSLADFSAIENFTPPPVLPQNAQRITSDWEAERERIENDRQKGNLVAGGVPHGFFFMRLQYLRGFESLMFDLFEESAELGRLMEMIKDHNAGLVGHYLDLDVDMVTFGEDLGTQTTSMISPEMFAKFVTPVYKELMAPVKQAGKLVYLHTDGFVMNLMDDFAAAGVDVINPQDLVNGIDALAAEVKGRFCIALDVDRQKTLAFGTPGDVHDLIEEEVRKLGSPEGGLQFIAGIYPPTPLENIEALCEAFEKFRTFWWD